MTRPELHEINRLSWNAATIAHNSHKPDQAGFLKNGGSTLFPEEIELLGEVQGKEAVHLLCNSGQDTLSLAKLGAKVTGVDISDEAIAFAKQLAADCGIAAEFERSDVYPWLEAAIAKGRQYDLVFCSYGALCWLSDLPRWMSLVAGILKPGGRFVCVEFHQVAMIFDEHGVPTYDYWMPEPLHWAVGISDYVGDSCGGLVASGEVVNREPFVNPYPCYEFQRGMGEILGSVLKSGLRLRDYREYLHSNGWKPFKEMQALPGRRWTMPEGKAKIPLMYGMVAVKE
ncbi:class I SAM-dependent methyltransferase [Haloferula sp. BvORR071]|uniref:class I SAM-dependent methyltransferase n=1 Tax=Haloferula sp. BvORR071 TaxID=1396141 RepID=UPI000558C591|nr:class I SAM-dependent methyltransferase [Haloferula sp. BvORR071]